MQVSHLEFRRVDTAASLLSLFLLLAGPLDAGVPGSTAPINVDPQGLALRGYDPVAYLEDGKPTRGVENLSASYGGARYVFASESHRKLFLENPKKYIPEYGGFCAVGTSFGEKVDVDPETGKIVNGRLYLNNGPKALEIELTGSHVKFLSHPKEVAALIEKAAKAAKAAK
jgi:YHS domain-containing protein